MKPEDGLKRVKRLKLWITTLTLVPGLVLFLTGPSRATAGFITGGAVVLLNLILTERVILAFVRGRGPGRFLVLLLYLGKLALTALILAAALLIGKVSPLALLLGVMTFLLALVFDFLVFPRNI